MVFASLVSVGMVACTHSEERRLTDALRADSAAKQIDVEKRNPEEEARVAFRTSKLMFYAFRETGLSVLSGISKECSASIFGRKDIKIEVLGFIEPPEMFTTSEYFEARLAFARRYNAVLAALIYHTPLNQPLEPTPFAPGSF